MTSEQVEKLLRTCAMSAPAGRPQLVETHISWVILSGGDVYKIKKPLHLHFLDFSTLEKRKFYCEREIMLNRRLTEDIYLGVLPVISRSGELFFRQPGEDPGHNDGEARNKEGDAGRQAEKLIDYVVHMRRMEEGRRMDKLLRKGQVTKKDMEMLAGKMAAFHRTADIISKKDPGDIPEKFADLVSEQDYLCGHRAICDPALISRAIGLSTRFCEKHEKRIRQRTGAGYTRDCHGDLHAGNIFLLETPQPFDCIEFNDDLRQIDVLNDIAFLCMDLEAFERKDLSERFLTSYLTRFPALETDEDKQLFIYYKSYRANVRAKINSLRARSAGTEAEKAAALTEAEKYLVLMNGYLRQLK
ncbi:MAG TPA: hypothetical protein VHC48_09395 [Puia sp.]|nr:hypothetical protein [Puia sp.]